MTGRYEAVAMGFEVPSPLSLTERFNHGQSIAVAHRIAQVVAIIQRADALARREHGAADTDSAGGEADRG
jgi:thiamine biosynthesis lipoprotein ApbE